MRPFSQLSEQEIISVILSWAKSDIHIACNMLRLAIPKVEDLEYKKKLEGILQYLLPKEKKFMEWVLKNQFDYIFSNLIIKPIRS